MKIAGLFFLLFLSTISTFACRFTIREIGYTRLNIETYLVKFELDTVANRELVKEFRNIADGYSGNSNMNYRIVHVQGRKPSLVCTNSNDNVIAENKVSGANDITVFFRQLFYSPLQKMMYNQIGNVFAFVVGFMMTVTVR